MNFLFCYRYISIEVKNGKKCTKYEALFTFGNDENLKNMLKHVRIVLKNNC